MRRRRTSSSSSSPIRPGATCGGSIATPSSSPPHGSTLRIRSREVEFAWGPAGGGAMSRARRDRDRDRGRPGRQGQRLARGPAFRGSRARRRRRGARVERAAGTRSGVGPRRLAADELAQRARLAARSGSRSTSGRSASTADSSSTGTPRGGARAFEVAALRRRLRVDDRSGRRSRPTGSAATSRCRAARRASSGSTCARAPVAMASASSASACARTTSRAPSTRSSTASRRRAPRSPSRAGCVREQSYWTPIGVASGSPSGAARTRTGCSRSIAAASRSSRSSSPPGASSPGRTSRSRRSCGTAGCRSRPRSGARTASCSRPPRSRRTRRAGPSSTFAIAIENTSDARRRGPLLLRAAPVPGHAAVAGVPGDGRREPDRRAPLARGRGLGRRAQGGDPARRAERLRRRGLRAGRRSRESLERGELPPRRSVSDAFRHASGALRFDLDLAAGRGAGGLSRDPVRNARAGARRLRRAATDRRRDAARRARCARWRDGSDASRSASRAAAHAVADAANRGRAHPDQPRRPRAPARPAALHAIVDPRRRDDGRGAAPHGLRRRGRATSCAGTRRYQSADGNVPCAVDREGPDWLPEHDSHGQLRLRDRRVLPLHARPRAPRRAVAGGAAGGRLHRVAARPAARRRVRSGERRACYGLLPESVSHEGYLAQPVHAYWDDFWALRGHRRRRAPGRASSATTPRRGVSPRCATSCELTLLRVDRDDHRGARARLRAGLRRVGRLRLTATATALTTTDAAERLPSAGGRRLHLRRYLARLPQAPRRRDRLEQLHAPTRSASSVRWCGSAARDEAHELLDFFLADRRPRAWNQWPEISWRDPRSPGHLGDVPHAWIGAEWMLAVLSLFAYEHATNGSLVLAAGIRRRVARRRRGGRDRGPADLVRAARPTRSSRHG